ncbi:MAG: hypothetical protein LC749_06345 [Actinobacteria bacterium]|nr:hypothetical protein [Actinomycetota bacterium]
MVARTRDSRQASSVVADAFDLGHSGRTPAEDRLRAYELFRREVVIGTWLRYLRTESDWDWPYALISELTSANPEEAWALLTTMIDLAPSDDINVLGAGFLEDLLGGPLADAWIERIEPRKE